MVLLSIQEHDDKQRGDGVKSGDKKKVFKYSAESELSTQLMDDLKRRVEETKQKVHFKLWQSIIKSLGKTTPFSFQKLNKMCMPHESSFWMNFITISLGY